MNQKHTTYSAIMAQMFAMELHLDTPQYTYIHM